ncbi:ParM/StbA family protein [Paraclostridium sp. AKS46]|nr:ParM/StbA family protein [Paraclostridium sp. AKS46]
MKDFQVLGLDIGRGYGKGYTVANGIKKECLFKSVIGEGRNIDFSEYKNDNPICINIDNQDNDYFVGVLAEKESYTPIRNSKDSKVTKTVQVLIGAMLNELAVMDEVKIMLGVPYKNFRKIVLAEIVDTYKGKTVTIKDKINGGYKKILISDISIFREGDAALYYALNGESNKDKPVGLVSVGFRTTEMSYFDKGFIFNDKRSKTTEFGNKDALTIVQDKLTNENIMKELNEIDSSNDYEDMKLKAYEIASEKLSQMIEDFWINTGEMDVYIAGGTSLNMKFDKEFKVLDNAQMATAIGLYMIGERRFK